MATVNEIISQVASETGLSTTGDATVLITNVNRAYRRINAEAKRLIPSSTTVTAALDITLLTAAPTLATLDSVWRISGTDDIPLERVTPERLYDMRVGADGYPTSYAVIHGTLALDAIEASSPSTLRLRYTARPTALVAGGAESTIVGIDPIYHEDLLGTLASVYILEGYEGVEERAAYYRRLYKDTLTLFKDSLIREGGVYNVRGDDTGRWSTADVASAR